MEPRGAQRHRRRHSPVGSRRSLAPAEGVDRRAAYAPSSTTSSARRYLPPWIFLATSGCRRGECLGLRWSDINLDETTAIIAPQVTALDHRVIVKQIPKTKRAT